MGRSSWRSQVAYLIAVGAVVLLVPTLGTDYLTHLAVLTLLYAYLGSSWNLVAGYAGQFSFGQAAFFGLGATISTLLGIRVGLTPWIGMLVGAAAAGVLGVFEGYLSLRYGLTGWHFSLTTWAFSEALRVIALNVGSGAAGMIIPLREAGGLVAFQFASRGSYLWVIYLFFCGIICLTTAIEKSSFGLRCVALRENVSAAEAAGIRTGFTKIAVMALSSSLTALGGTFYAQYLMYIDPNLAFGREVTTEMIIRTVIGGAGTVWGPFIGSVILTPVGEVINSLLGGKVVGANLALYGMLLIFIILYAPKGILRIRWKPNASKAPLRGEVRP